MHEQTEVDYEQQLVEDILGFADDPLGYVLYAFPWGEAGTELANKTGPREWQCEVLDSIGQQIRAGAKDLGEVVREAVASGHGIGKSALVSWIIKWALDTAVDTRGVVTANTESQLRTKTWPEVAKWNRLSITAHWFKLTGTALISTDPAHEKNWRIDAVPWSDTNTEAFAGLHNEGKRILLIFDEASAIADLVWEVAEGALTDADTEIIWAAFGNPTRNSGRFRECFTKFKHRWRHRQVDSRTVDGTNKTQIAKWIADYGEDSDFVRIRVRGMFPRASDLQLIPTDWVAEAMRREAVFGMDDALVCGIDIARGGMDNNVIRFRRGMDARSIKPIKIPGSETRDTTKFIARVCTEVVERRPDAVFVDSTGVGGPVADQLRRLLPGVVIIDVNFASQAPDRHYSNMRTWIWWRMREAIKSGLAIESDTELETELTSPEYDHNATDQLALEKKKDIKKRLGISPDDGDALALTFTMPVMKAQYQGNGGLNGSHQSHYDPFNS